MTLNTASPTDPSLRKPIAEFAGPLLNLAIAGGAALAYRISQRVLWAALALAAAIMRLVVYAFVLGGTIVAGSALSMGNDEPIAANLWGLPALTLVGVLTVPFVAVVWSIVRTFEGNGLKKAFHVLGLSVTMLVIGIIVGNVLDPWLFPNR